MGTKSSGAGYRPARGPGNGNPKAPPLDTSPEKQRERAAQKSTLREKMRAWREKQERENPDYQGTPVPLSRPQIEALARSHAPDAIDVLVGLATSERTAAVARVTAANSLLDRGYGKARETVDLNNRIESMSADEARAALDTRIAELSRSRSAGEGATSPDRDAGDQA